MKKILAIIGVAALLATVLTETASAVNGDPTYGASGFTPPPILATGTTNIPQGTAGTVLAVGKQQNVSISTTVTASVNGATNIYYFAPSVDAVYYDTNISDCFALTNACLAATYSNTVCAKFFIGGNGYLRLSQVVTVAQASGNITNVSATYGIKTSAP